MKTQPTKPSIDLTPLRELQSRRRQIVGDIESCQRIKSDSAAEADRLIKTSRPTDEVACMEIGRLRARAEIAENHGLALEDDLAAVNREIRALIPQLSGPITEVANRLIDPVRSQIDEALRAFVQEDHLRRPFVDEILPLTPIWSATREARSFSGAIIGNPDAEANMDFAFGCVDRLNKLVAAA